MEHAKLHYRRSGGSSTNEYNDYRYSLRPLIHLYGNTAARAFGPLALKAVRQLMTDGYMHLKHKEQPALARRVTNQRNRRLVRVFKWGASEELVPETVWRALTTVNGLQKGRCTARETEPIRPIALAHVEATLPHLS
jgi:hypothetical protein